MPKTSTNILLFTSFSIFLVYLFTSAPGLGLIDSGELTAVVWKLGIAHPTGYPLYTIIGHLFSMLPFANVARTMVIFSSLCMAAACSILLWTGAQIIQKYFECSPITAVIFSTIGILTFTFSMTAWQTAAYAEVYPLSLLLTSILYALGTRMLISTKTDGRLWIAFGFVFGLALGNHLSVVWTFPLGLVVLWHCFGTGRTVLRALLLALPAGILGASVILFLPLRSHLDPVLDWGNPETLGLLWRHLTGWQYQVWMFQSGIISRIISYVRTLPLDMGWGGVVLVLLGICGLAKRDSRVLIALLLVWFFGVLYNVNYDIPDIAPYFLPAHAALSLIAVAGAVTLWHFINPRMKAMRIALMVLLAIPVLANVITHFSKANRSNDHFPAAFAREVLRTLPPNALVLHSLWDLQSPAIYLQEVEGYRTDVALMDVNLMRRQWYVEQFSRKHPDVIAGSERECNSFLHELIPFDAGKFYEAAAIENAFTALHNSIIEKNLKQRPVYLRFMREAGHSQIGTSFPAVPGAFFYRLGVQENSKEPLLNVEEILGSRKRFDEREKYLLTRILQVFFSRLKFQETSDQTEEIARQLQLLQSVL
ncbi:DUF2723 domain-containing protein [bacterium]|nr:DUF2723 domain-containing protein [bacterium]